MRFLNLACARASFAVNLPTIRFSPHALHNSVKSVIKILVYDINALYLYLIHFQDQIYTHTILKDAQCYENQTSTFFRVSIKGKLTRATHLL
jgi:hypothetical protein